MMVIEQELYENVCKETGFNYEGNFKEDGWVNTDESNYLVSDKSILEMLEDLICEVEHWKEEYQDLKKDIEEKYEPKEINPYHEYGVSESDFH